MRDELQLSGWVSNDSAGVTIEIQGSRQAVQRFIESFHQHLPPLAKVDALEVHEIPLADESDFVILDSVASEGESTPVSPEISICGDCLRELNDTGDRRYRYPFINCTNCGPRFTIVEDIPYDRALTTMKSFPMCRSCLQEYEDPADRRFHAQPNACHDCGPQIWFVSDAKRASDFETYRDSELAVGDAAVHAFRTSIQLGEVVAVKGVGGFHLACDATNDRAVARLRERKGRVDKPLAVMVREVQACESFATVTHQERTLLESKERPIVLVAKNPGQVISPQVAPGNDFVGVMLPYSPLHVLLLEESPPLVMTSGNLTDEPIVRQNLEAKQRLSGIADRFLLHDREIHVVCDDSVVRCIDTDLLPIRRSRGYAPMPVRLRRSGPSVLAVGGEIKATICATKADYAYVGPHIGDMGNLETLAAMRRSVDHLLRLFRIQPKAIAADLHPGYLSTVWARELAASRSVPLIQVQHHHAHVVSLLAEHGFSSDRRIIGCCFDGTGFGSDQAIWGGEFLIADAGGFDRLAHLKYVPLPGGDAGIRRPYRMALAHLHAAGHPWESSLPCVGVCDAAERRILRQQLDQSINCVATSSMGRLFDAVSSLIGIRHTVNYEAQAAMEMEALAASVVNDVSVSMKRYRFELQGTAPIEINPAALLDMICEDLNSGETQATIAARFHQAVARMVVDVCLAAREKVSINDVGLSGGVFQNVQLLRLTQAKLREHGFEVWTHRQVPPNDGGIALGQALVAVERMAAEGATGAGK